MHNSNLGLISLEFLHFIVEEVISIVLALLLFIGYPSCFIVFLVLSFLSKGFSLISDGSNFLCILFITTLFISFLPFHSESFLFLLDFTLFFSFISLLLKSDKKIFFSFCVNSLSFSNKLRVFFRLLLSFNLIAFSL
jgi:hypothetical protein